MRHLKHRNQLGRKKEHRQALISNLTAALLRHGKVQTTLPKAKALRPFAERIITLAKQADGASPERALHYRRLALSRVRDGDAVRILFKERVSEFKDRTGGYTRIYKLGARRGDAAEMAVIQLIPADDEGYAKRARKGAGKASAKAAAVEPVAPEAEAADTAVAEADVATEAVVAEPAATEDVAAAEPTAEVESGDKPEKA